MSARDWYNRGRADRRLPVFRAPGGWQARYYGRGWMGYPLTGRVRS